MANLAAYGPGVIIITRTDIPNQTPINVGFANEFSLDESGDVSNNFGQFSSPLDVARGECKYTGKMKAARISGLALNAAFHGETLTAGSISMQSGELETVPAATSLNASAATAAGGTVLTFAAPPGVQAGQVVVGANIAAGTTVQSVNGNTVIVPATAISGAGVAVAQVVTFGPVYVAANGANFNADLGVVYNSTINAGLPLIYSASGPAVACQYGVNTTTGTYFFHPSDAGKQMSHTYAWNNASVGQTKVVIAHTLGYTPTFQIDYATTYSGRQLYVRCFRAVSSKLSKQFKLKDFMNPEIDFSLAMNASNQIYAEYYPEVS